MSATESQTDATYRNINVECNVEAWRCRLRETGYLQGSDTTHKSITGVELHTDLASFRRLAEGKRSNRLASAYLSRADEPEDYQPVFVTNEEYQEFNQVERKTVPEIKKMIEQGIRLLVQSEDDQDYLLSKYSKIRRKADFVSLYHEIISIHTNQSSSAIEDEVD